MCIRDRSIYVWYENNISLWAHTFLYSVNTFKYFIISFFLIFPKSWQIASCIFWGKNSNILDIWPKVRAVSYTHLLRRKSPNTIIRKIGPVAFRQNIKFIVFCFVVTLISITISTLISCLWRDKSIRGEFIPVSYTHLCRHICATAILRYAWDVSGGDG